MSDASRLVAVVSDAHFPTVHWATWWAFRAWVDACGPEQIVLLGDMVDLPMVSRHEKTAFDPVHILDDIEALKPEANALAATGAGIIYSLGNHERRYSSYLAGANPHVLKGLKGLTWADQCLAQGFDARIAFHEECVEQPQLTVAQFKLQHGHVGAGKFGAGKFPARLMLNKSFGTSVCEGHHHRADLATSTAYGHDVICVANPCMAAAMSYPGYRLPWQRGFTILELDAPDYARATPHLIVMQDGRFSFGGRTFDGNIRTRVRPPQPSSPAAPSPPVPVAPPARGGGQPGERNGLAKLTAAKVHEIRRRKRAGDSVSAIARAVAVARSTVNHVLAGRTWAHLPEEVA
jgi:hypothetical protein